jgi:hypothetical protein
MRKPSFMNVSPEEFERVEHFLRTSLYYDKNGQIKGHRRRHRAQIVYFSLMGRTVLWIAHEFHISQQTVWKWRRIYRQKGLEGIKGTYR